MNMIEFLIGLAIGALLVDIAFMRWEDQSWFGIIARALGLTILIFTWLMLIVSQGQ
jgi:hypothetical protein